MSVKTFESSHKSMLQKRISKYAKYLFSVSSKCSKTIRSYVMLVLHAADGPHHFDPIIWLQILQITRHGACGSWINPKKDLTRAIVEANGSVTPNFPLATNERSQLNANITRCMKFRSTLHFNTCTPAHASLWAKLQPKCQPAAKCE